MSSIDPAPRDRQWPDPELDVATPWPTPLVVRARAQRDERRRRRLAGALLGLSVVVFLAAFGFFLAPA